MPNSRLSVSRWGNGYGLRLPRMLLSAMQARSGDVLDVEVTPGTMVLRIAEPGGGDAAWDGGPAEDDDVPLDFDAVQRSLQSIVDQAGRLSEAMERRAGAKGRVSRRVVDRNRAPSV
jgi:hypothetical protein